MVCFQYLCKYDSSSLVRNGTVPVRRRINNHSRWFLTLNRKANPAYEDDRQKPGLSSHINFKLRLKCCLAKSSTSNSNQSLMSFLNMDV